MTNQLEERPRASEEKVLAIVGLVLAFVGAVPVIVDLKSAVAKFVGVLIAVVLAALLLRGLRLWSRRQLDPFLAVLIVFFTLCTLIPLTILSSKDSKAAPPSGTGGNLLTTTSIDNIPTCGVFAIKAECDKWKDFSAAKKEFWFFDYPKAGLEE